jgi:ABC-type Mn2+/Zn2+ transport system permease subunit
VLVWALEDRARLATETIIGVVFSAALAIGTMLTTGEDLIDALFGGAGTISSFELAFGLIASAAVVWFVIRQKHALVLAVVSPELARTAGVNVRRLNLLYMLAFALTIALGLRYLGVLLMGSLLIIPAGTARRVTAALTPMLTVGVALAILETAAGTALAAVIHRQTGPTIVTLAAAVFLCSLSGTQSAPRA